MAAYTAISLCSGVGMLDTGLNLALGGKFKPILHVEREAFCAANLAWQAEKKFMAEAAIWSDVRTVTSAECRDYVCTALGERKLDFIIGGIPCQPYSHAGKRFGGDDERDLWPAALAAIACYQPSFVFIENVEGMASHVDGARRILSDLEGAGYRAKAGLFSSKECGANQGRKRWFFLGIAASERLEGRSKERRAGNFERSVDIMADSKDERLSFWRSEYKRKGNVVIAGSDSREEELAAIHYAPARNDFGAWGVVAEMDAARMPAIESKIRGMVDGLAHRDLQLHAIGNGVDPLVAAYAFCTLWACMQED